MTIDKKAIGKRLKHTRERKRLKQNYVAQKIGVHNSTLNKYESGEREPDLETLHKLAEIYEVTTDYLLCRTDHPKGIVLQGKTEEEKQKIYEEFVKEKANEPVTFNGKPLTPEQAEFISNLLDKVSDLTPEELQHLKKTTELTIEGFKIAENKKEGKGS